MLHRATCAVLVTAALTAVSCYEGDYAYEGDILDPALDTMSADELFTVASGFYGVPKDLLIAIAWHESGFAPPPAEDLAEIEHRPSQGWMGLTPSRAADAAALTGAGIDVLLERREQNILAGAVLLDAIRDGVAPDAPDGRVDEQWWPVVVAWSELGEPWLDDDFAWDVFRTLQTGLVTQTADGEDLTISVSRMPGLGSVPYLAPPEDLGARDSSGYPGRARFVSAASGNQGSRSGGTGAVERIVIHTTEGSYAGAISWFQDPSSHVSAHYVIRRSDGEVTQMVADGDKGFHACQNNADTIGIEHEGTSYSASQWTAAQIDSSARLTAWLVTQYDIPIDRDHIVGHGEIQPSSCAGRDDPGTWFPWNDYLVKVANYAGAPGPGDDDTPAPGPLVSWLAPTDAQTVTSPVTLRATHPGTDHIELWSGPLLLAEHRQEDPVETSATFALGPRVLTIRGYAAAGSLLARRDITVTVAEAATGDDDSTPGDDDSTGSDDDTAPGDDDSTGDDDAACPVDECVVSLPYVGASMTTGSSSNWDSYNCAPGINESGPERVYRVVVPVSGTLRAVISDGAGVDVDVHILSAQNAASCLARGHTEAATPVSAGTAWVSVDSWVNASGTEFDGPYSMTLTLEPAVGCAWDDCPGSLPFAVSATTLGGQDDWDSYGCAPTVNEGGPERVYQVNVPQAGVLSASVVDGDGVDVDVHLLSSPDPGACLARGHTGAVSPVDPGTAWVVVDSWVNSSGTEFEGAFDLQVRLLPMATGNCATETNPIARVGTSALLPMPATGPVVLEAHLVTVDDGYGTSSSGPWPGSQTENIQGHYATSEAAASFTMVRDQIWAPEESSEFGQGAYGAKLPVLDEAWYLNMYWQNRPAAGTRMIVSANGRTVVAAGGYETGPGNLAHIAGVTEEIHHYLGTGHLDSMTVGFAVDQSLAIGPILCE